MSQWTHLCGLVRISMSLRLCLEEIADILRQDIPVGTEGPAYVFTAPEIEGHYSDEIYVVGDLRSVGRNDSEIESIVFWFREALDKLNIEYNVLVRSAILQIDVESKPTHILSTTGGLDALEHIVIPVKTHSSDTTAREGNGDN